MSNDTPYAKAVLGYTERRLVEKYGPADEAAPAPDAGGEWREMTVEAIRQRRASLYKGLAYRSDPNAAGAMKSDLDYLLSIQDSHEEEVDKELSRWQDAIRDKLINLGAPDWKIDGAGCDSGDPLDFTLAEVGQGAGYFVDQLDALKVALNELLVEAETSCVLWQQSRGFVGTVQDAYDKNLMPPAYSRAKAALSTLKSQ
jgi:hypothetical protein